jgi:hypothetical protein
VTGRLGVSSQTGKYHYWLVKVPAGKFKVVLDIKRADDKAWFIGGNLSWFSPEGEKLRDLGGVGDNNYRTRGIHRFEVKKAIKLVLRYENNETISDYWLGIFPDDAKIGAPFFVKCPKVQFMTLGQPTTIVLDGDKPLGRDAYYTIELRPGDYKVTLSFERADGKKWFIGGNVTAFDPDGTHGQVLLGIGDNEISIKKVGKLSLADKVKALILLRAAETKEICTLTISKWEEE